MAEKFMSEEEQEEEDDGGGGRSEPPSTSTVWAGGHQHCKEILQEVCYQQ